MRLCGCVAGLEWCRDVRGAEMSGLWLAELMRPSFTLLLLPHAAFRDGRRSR